MKRIVRFVVSVRDFFSLALRAVVACTPRHGDAPIDFPKEKH